MGDEVALKLVPLQGVVASSTERNRWQVLHDHPQFDLPGIERWTGRWVRLRSRLKVHDVESTWPVLLFDCGGGYSALEQLVLPECTPLAPDIDYIFFVPHELKSARLEPVSRRTDFTLGEVRVTPLSSDATSRRMLAAVFRMDGLIATLPYVVHELLSLVRVPERSARRNLLTDRYRDICMRRGRTYLDWIRAFEPSARIV